MAKRAVVEIECGRCARKEYRDAPTSTMEEVPSFKASLVLSGPQDVGRASMQIVFEDLCTPCMNTVKGHLSQIAKKIEGVSPVRQKKEKPPAQEVEVLPTKAADKAPKHTPKFRDDSKFTP